MSMDVNLDINDTVAMAAAQCVRNAMEDFHADGSENKIEGLDDAAMAKLNPIIRRAIYEVLIAFDPENPEGERILHWLFLSVPNYWEPPSQLPPIE